MKKKIITGLFKTIALLPLPVLYCLSDFLAFVLGRLIGYRKEVIMRNLASSFPEKDERELRSITRKFYRHLTDIVVETVKVFHISERQMRRRAEVVDYEKVNESLEAGRSAVIFLGHYGNWEWVQEISRYFVPGTYMGDIYRAMYDKTWNDIFLSLRSRWGAHQIEHDEAFRKILTLSRDKVVWAIGFIADQRPFSYKLSHWTRFLNHRTAFTVGAEEIGRRTGADFFYLDITQKKRGYYSMRFIRLEPVDDGEPYPYTRSFYRHLEATIRRDPPLWLWSHNRWAFQEEEQESGEEKVAST